jgi:acetyl esterase/lipase
MKATLVLVFLLIAPVLVAQEVVDLWQGKPPYSKPNQLEEYVKESWGVPCVHNVTRPTLSIHRAQGENSGHAMVVLPGGGYEVESFVGEGRQIAEYLASQGITAAVLKYRLPLAEASDQPHLVPITDARRALQLMRSKADELEFDPGKLGIVGFSAGGHLATATSVLASDSTVEKPDFAALIYPVTTIEPENRQWLEETLFHREMTEAELRQYSLVDQVDATTPPAFLLHAWDDDVVPISESLRFAEAMAAAGREVEAHYFPKGGHGFGPGRPGDGTDQWLGLLADWVKRQ